MAAVVVVMTLGCELVVGLDKFDKVDCGVGQCGAIEAGPDGDSATDAPPDGNLGDVLSNPAKWAQWPIPNPTRWDAGVPDASIQPAFYTSDFTNGVIKDEVTKLVWAVKDYHAMASSELDAETYCKGLKTLSPIVWRVPSRIELATLIDFTAKTKALDPAIEAAGGVTITGNHWTSSPSRTTSNVDYYWRVSFNFGESMVTSTTTGSGPVLCVSGGG